MNIPVTAGETAFLERVLGRPLRLVPMAADASARRFFRAGGRVVVLPDLEDPHGLSEAGSFFHIGRHLFACGAPVPEMFAFCPETGAVVCEDCGRELLFDRVRAEGFRFSAGVRGLYRRVAAGLARMQVRAARGFDPAWCWQDAAHDREVMLARESFYFLDEMVRARAGIEPGTGVREELAALAGRAARVRPRLFMHRDFQSRNIVLGPGDRPRFIDFQSGRIGPAAYDLASLLEDPYVAMPDGLKEELFTLYLDTLAGICDIEKPRFRREYPLLAAQRLMQALGAFARLSRLGKEGFAAHIPAALAGLARALAACGAFPALAGLVEEIIQSQGQR